MYLFFTAVLAVFIVFCIVYPLWYFATAASSLYTVILISLVFLYVLFLLSRKFWKKYVSFKDKNDRRRWGLKTTFTLLAILCIILTPVLSVKCVLSEQRLIALLIFVAGIVLSTLCFSFRKRHSDV